MIGSFFLRQRNGRVLGATYFLATSLLLANLLRDMLTGGNSWKQADWLVNSEEVFVRRGLFGSGLLRLSDLLAVKPLLLVGALQAILMLALIGATIVAARRSGLTDRVLLLLLSPGFFVLFWAADPQGSLRKEMIVYLALAALALAATGVWKRALAIPLSIVLMGVAVLAHEGMIFFLPAFLAALHFTFADERDGGPRLRCKISLYLAISVAVAIPFLVNLTATRLSDVAPVCEPLLRRGFPVQFCDGSVEALTHALGYEMGLSAEIVAANGLLWLAPSVLFAFAGLATYLADGRNTNWRLAALLLVIGLPFLPLYVVAIDWGRWLDFHVTSATFVLLIMRASGHAPEPARSLDERLRKLLILGSLVFGFSHMGADARQGGFLAKIFNAMIGFFVRA